MVRKIPNFCKTMYKLIKKFERICSDLYVFRQNYNKLIKINYKNLLIIIINYYK